MPEPSSGDLASLISGQDSVNAYLSQFVLMVVPAMIVHPLARWVRSNWAFEWRVALMRSYFDQWSPNHAPIEGAAQRLHEDTQRFAKGMETCVVTVLDSVTTLCVFVPVLATLGESVTPPDAFAWPGGMWLVVVAVTTASVGLLGAVLAGRKLVLLEVDNQRVEAALRKNLVLLETAPAAVCPTTAGDITEECSSDPGAPDGLKLPDFASIWLRLVRNYRRLFVNFLGLNTWLSVWDQLVIILPYTLVAPLLFETNADRRIHMGTLVQTSDSFAKVFGALAVVADNWGAINEFVSAVVRLKEFERSLQFVVKNSNDGRLMARNLPRSDENGNTKTPKCPRGPPSSPVRPAELEFTDSPLPQAES